jgi:FAD/FMN-containing dehydrogenase
MSSSSCVSSSPLCLILSNIEQQCALLAQALANLVAFPESASFTQTLQSYWSFQEASLRPSCIVSPRSAVDVSKTISILTSTSQTGQDSSCKFAIKSQGHAPAAGFANIADGVTIDLSSLKAVSLSNDKEVAYVGSGATWLDVYAYLDPFNLTVAGGRNGAVGVGGLTLGGGISYIGPRVGWVCDNVENFEVPIPLSSRYT